MLPGESHGGHLGVILGCRDKSDSRALMQHRWQPRTILACYDHSTAQEN